MKRSVKCIKEMINMHSSSRNNKLESVQCPVWWSSSPVWQKPKFWDTMWEFHYHGNIGSSDANLDDTVKFAYLKYLWLHAQICDIYPVQVDLYSQFCLNTGTKIFVIMTWQWDCFSQYCRTPLNWQTLKTPLSTGIWEMSHTELSQFYVQKPKFPLPLTMTIDQSEVTLNDTSKLSNNSKPSFIKTLGLISCTVQSNTVVKRPRHLFGKSHSLLLLVLPYFARDSKQSPVSDAMFLYL